jgi:hypothetical protein
MLYDANSIVLQRILLRNGNYRTKNTMQYVKTGINVAINMGLRKVSDYIATICTIILIYIPLLGNALRILRDNFLYQICSTLNFVLF